MATTWRPRSVVGHPVNAPSPLRHASTASSNSSASGAPSRSSTLSSRASHKMYAVTDRTSLDAVTARAAEKEEPAPSSPSDAYMSMRRALRPTVNAFAKPSPSDASGQQNAHNRSRSVDHASVAVGSAAFDATAKTRPFSISLARSDSLRGALDGLGAQGTAHVHFSPRVEQPELQQFQRSSTGHLRALSAFAQNGDGDEFAIRSKEHAVAGLNGRRKLQRGNSVRAQKSHTGWGGRTWMDQQRQYLQAYEYLCHIGEAKEWIEDIIQRSIPPIVQLEEALRDGVVLAEIVQALHPDQRLRIFRGPTLTFRHSENVAIFFRLLEEVELPDLFWFELVDLYEKKNIPKVIYCIHSLSWLLWRKGMTDFRIGNLVGQLQFEDHELEATQKGLDRAGISMPNFSEMGASFGAEPEPVESEDDRVNRELSDSKSVIIDLQSQARGALLRQQLGEVMQMLWGAEDWIVDLQSRIRGECSREIVQYRLDMKSFAVDLQSATRGFLARSRASDARFHLKTQDRKVTALQTLIRGHMSRAATNSVKVYTQRHEHGIRQFQSAIRGALARRNVTDYCQATRQEETGVKNLQASIRGALLRQRIEHDAHELHLAGGKIQCLQSIARGLLQRQTLQRNSALLREQESAVSSLQAAVRACRIRRRDAGIRSQLQDFQPQWKTLQAFSLAFLVRREVHATRDELLQHSTSCVSLQSSIRSFLARRRKQQQLRELETQRGSILALQAASLGYLLRQRTFDLLCTLNDQDTSIAGFQSAARGLLCRSGLGQLLQQLEPVEPLIMELQALARGKVVRTQFAEKMQHYKENMEKVIKIQSFVRGRQQGEAYKVLTSGKNPPVGTVKNFVHLLNDSDFDFDEEIEFERLRKTVAQRVRENTHAEQYIDQLDIKIALLVKNKITLDDVVRHQKHFGGHVGNLLTNKDVSSSRDPLDLKALNKNSRKKLEHYQELFFLLQTQPQYLARLLRNLRGRALPEQEAKKIELLVMGIFGFAQKRREEYHLLKLMTRCIKEELDSCETLQDYLRGSSLWSKLLSSYARSPRDRKYLKDTLSPLVKEDIIENESLDLESDPMQIYRSAINNEELRTGQRSRRPADIPREDAIRDPETRETFIRHLQDLRDIADHFLLCLEETVNRMPYGMRYMALQMFECLSSKFGQEPQQHVLAVVGHWLWKFYLQPAVLQPDTWGVVDRGLSPMQKRNLGEVSKVVGQIAAGRLFGDDNVYLQPINPYISEALGRIEDIWANVINVQPAEIQFDIDEFNDLYTKTKPTLYMKLTDIISIHQFVAQDIAVICPNRDDVLREVIQELGSAKNNEADMLSGSSTEITLMLNPKFHDVEDPDAGVKSLFMETKRCVLYIIRIQSGKNLLDIMIRPITPEDEDRWAQLVHDELTQQNLDPKKRNPYQDSSSLLDMASLAYTELKRTALENILALEKTGRITRVNHYQDLLNAIALDIRTKHRRRVQRSREMENARATMAALEEKQVWLRSQLKSYNDYIEQAMVTLQQKAKGKKRFLLPFTKQYNHERELARTGRVPRFGSFKYSARNLFEKGVLVGWRGYHERQWDKVNLTISSDEVGLFHVEGSTGSMMIPGASAAVTLDDLLQAQFNNLHFICLFGADDGGQGEGPLKLNVNLLVHLLMKKFYSQP